MTDVQPPLFNVRSSDPDTSHLAAVRPRSDSWLQAEIRELLLFTRMTDWELTTNLGLPAYRKPTVGKRRQEIGAVDTGERRPSPMGRPCVVWTLP